MHLGIARTFLAAWLDARAHAGEVRLRFEDIDRPRNIPGAIDAMQRDLEWLGLTWDGAPTRQTDRAERYVAVLETLAASGRVYPCFCSRREIALASAPHGPGDDGPRYPGTCRDQAPPTAHRAPSLRLRTHPHDRVTHHDRLLKDASQDVFQAVGDFVLRRADGLFAYQLAVTIDDLDGQITDVVRGADLLGSTARQILLRTLIAPDAPPLKTLHVPLLLSPDGRRLAKRDRDTTIHALRNRGVSAEAIVGRLAQTLGIHPTGDPTTAGALISVWQVDRLSTDPVGVSEFGLTHRI